MSERHDALIKERQPTHGDYETQAWLAQCLKAVMREGPNWQHLTHGQKEALEMIQSKVARVLAGNPDHIDHWDDIGGYARLASKGR